MRRIRQHLTYANVMVTILAFFVLGGGTALAAFVVSSNSQIGPGTVSGHHPPAGDHSNVIAGSITTNDLAAGGVTEGKLAGTAVSTAKLADGAVTRSKLDDNAIDSSKIGLISHTESSPADSTMTKSLTAQCPVGTTVVGGSATTNDGSGGDPGAVALSSDGLQLFLNGWHARAYATSAVGNWELVVTTICVRH